MPDKEINPNETLLEKCLREQKGEAVPDFDPTLYAEVELAVAYHGGKVYGSTIARVTGINSANVSAWIAGKLQQGIRHGYVSITLAERDELRARKGSKS